MSAAEEPTVELVRIWCDHGALHPWVASHVDCRGWVVDVLGRADTRESAVQLWIGDPAGLPVAGSA